VIQRFKTRLAEKIRSREIALAMIVDRSGRILWHHGRPVSGRTVAEGHGFSRSGLLRVLEDGRTLNQRDVMISSGEDSVPASARLLFVKSLFVHAIDDDLVLYVDSGNDAFEPSDIEFFTENSDALKTIMSELRNLDGRDGGITGDSPAARRMRQLVISYALEEEPVLLLGDTGVGKSHIAQMIHRFSSRGGQFIIVDTPALPEGLFESELFGHKKGSFTSAERDKKGLVEAAENGTLFFDEVAEVPLAFQAKLLRLIDTRRFRPLGDTQDRSAAVRIIAATNRDLKDEIARHRFRDDLFYRLDVLSIDIPPLRERPEDVRTLILEHEHLLRGKALGEGFWEVVLAYDWPGNVRELINLMKRAGILLPGPAIGREIGDLLARRGTQPGDADEGAGIVDRLRTQIDGGRSFWDTAWAAFLDREINRGQLRRLLAYYYGKSDHSLRETARRLNIGDARYPRFVSALHRYRVHPGQES